jgi:hypothetical protein
MPVGGITVEEEQETVKALRLLRALRHHFVQKNSWTLGLTLDGVPIMLVRYRPQPDGPHPVDADLSGVDL